MFEQTRALCDTFLEMGVPGFDLTVLHRGQCVLRLLGGHSDAEGKRPVSGQERYYLYSCSKPITCAAAMQLWEQGKFSLEDRLSDYLPEFSEMTVQTENGLRTAENPILIRHLFEMTAGFSYALHSPQLERCRAETGGRCATRETMRYLAKEPLLFEPGNRWNYSLCHDVLAALVEVLSGELFEDYVQAHIFGPLGMTRTTFRLPEAEQNELACQYAYDAESGQYRVCTGNRYVLGTDYASGGAGCVSCPEDYVRFLEAMRVGGSILRPQTLAMMCVNRLTQAQLRTFTARETHGYGLGVRAPMQDGARVDFGWGGASGSLLCVDVPHEITLFYAQHVLSAPNQALRKNLYLTALADLTGTDAGPVLPADAEENRYTY